jgi:hypothetical protein
LKKAGVLAVAGADKEIVGAIIGEKLSNKLAAKRVFFPIQGHCQHKGYYQVEQT